MTINKVDNYIYMDCIVVDYLNMGYLVISMVGVGLSECL